MAKRPRRKRTLTPEENALIASAQDFMRHEMAKQIRAGLRRGLTIRQMSELLERPEDEIRSLLVKPKRTKQ